MRIILLKAALVSLLAGFPGYAAGMGGAKLALPFMGESKSAHLVWDFSVAFGSIGLALMRAGCWPDIFVNRRLLPDDRVQNPNE